MDKKNKVQKYYLFDGSINGSGFSASAPGMLDLEIVDCIGFDTFKVRDLSLLPEKYNPAVVLELPGEKSAWQFNIKSVDRAKNLVKLDRPHGLQRKNDQWVRTHYQQQNFDGKAYIKIGLPNFTNK